MYMYYTCMYIHILVVCNYNVRTCTYIYVFVCINFVQMCITDCQCTWIQSTDNIHVHVFIIHVYTCTCIIIYMYMYVYTPGLSAEEAAAAK